MMLPFAEEELLVGVLPAGEAEADETGQEDDDLRARDARATDKLVEGEKLWLSLRIVGMQGLEKLLDGICISHDDGCGICP